MSWLFLHCSELVPSLLMFFEMFPRVPKGFSLVEFYGISTVVGYFMPNPFYTYIKNIYDLVWLGFIAYQPL